MAPSYVNLNREIAVSLTTDFNASAIDASVDYQPILNTVSAARIYQGNLPSWTDGVFAFPTVDIPTVSVAPNTVSVALNVEARSAYVDCRDLSNYSISRLDADDGSATITFSGVDRGCEVSIKGGVSGVSQTYLKTSPKTNCPDDAGYSRLIMFVGSYDGNAPYLLSNLSFISCMPLYRKTPGYLNITRAISSSSSLGFAPDAAHTMDARFNSSPFFEQDVQAVQQFTPDSPDFTSALGEVILSYSRLKWPDDWISADHMMSSVSVIFTTTFAVLAASVAYQPVSKAATASATLTSSKYRLHVVPWIAGCFFAVFGVLILQTILTYWYVQKNRTFLEEEPKGLLSSADIVSNSENLSQVVREAQADPAYQGKICKYVEAKYDIDSTRCWVSGTPRGTEIVLRTPQPKKIKNTEEKTFGRFFTGCWHS